MATKKFSELNALTTPVPSTDYGAIVSGGKTKRMLLKYILVGGNQAITTLTTLANPDSAVDYLLISDTDVSLNKKILINDLFRGAGGSVSNTAVGWHALAANTIGSYNIAVGQDALAANTTGSYNTAVGRHALAANITGSDNTAVGRAALLANTTGSYNTAVGRYAGAGITSGENLTCVGYNAAPSAVDAVNEVTLGDTTVTMLRCKVTTITGLSDERDKSNIAPLGLGLDFIRDLRPKKWTWDIRAEEKIKGTKDVEDVGFVAQDLDLVQKTHGVIPGLVFKPNADRWESSPGKLLPVAIQAIQELATKVDVLEGRLNNA